MGSLVKLLLFNVSNFHKYFSNTIVILWLFNNLTCAQNYTIEVAGKFKSLDNFYRVYNRKRGLYLIVMYLVVGQWRIHRLAYTFSLKVLYLGFTVGSYFPSSLIFWLTGLIYQLIPLQSLTGDKQQKLL
ncbi:hypothetical protein NIES2107_72460 (plasmid) [Nostoc carneum NIES-2107]|nr:hypothetical protein NIES2107_72460 [Nostoc carneum NIES-2107]